MHAVAIAASATEPPPYGAEGASANVGIMCNLRWTVWLVRWRTGIQATSWAAEWHNGVARQSVADGHVRSSTGSVCDAGMSFHEWVTRPCVQVGPVAQVHVTLARIVAECGGTLGSTA